MKIVDIRGCRIGEGIPKICVPLMGSSSKVLYEEAKIVLSSGADLAEWRADWFSNWRDSDAVQNALAMLRKGLGDMPLLVTFRTKNEGGQEEITPSEYHAFYRSVMQSGDADLIDLELLLDENVIRELLLEAREQNVLTVCSNHDFQKTPDQNELRKRLRLMEQMGADIAKIAVMPQSGKDVAALLSVTAEAADTLSCPVITMSMGQMGMVSRMAGQTFGSAVTFGTVDKASAPGQIPVGTLKEILNLLNYG